MLTKILMVVVVLGIVPFCLGLPWLRIIKPHNKYSFSYGAGCFISLAIYQLISFPIIMLHGKFITIVTIYSIALLLGSGISIWSALSKRYLMKITGSIKQINWTEWIYIIAIVCIISVQIIRGFTKDLTYMSYDDATYTTIAADAYAGNGLLTIDPFTGVGTNLSTKYAMSSWIIIPSYYATVSGVSVATISHTVQYVQIIVLTYSIYWFVAGEVLKKRESQLVFMLIVVLFYWFGYHSHYSLTFRLLGPNYQGKAVLAVALTPMVLSVMIKTLEEPYSRYTGCFYMILSFSSIALTLWGAGTMLIIVIIPLILSLFRKKRNWRHLLYGLYGCIGPALSFAFYFMYKFAV